jgi:signal transduction histidine kinase
MSKRDWDDPPAPRTGQSNPSASRRTVAAHSRPRALLSVRVRILLPVLLAAVGVATLGTIQVNDALITAGQADRSLVLATASGAIGRAIHEVAHEYTLSSQDRRSGDPTALLIDQQDVTDDAVKKFLALKPALAASAPDLQVLLDTARKGLENLQDARSLAAQNPDDSAEVFAYYSGTLTSLLALANAISPQMSNPRLIELSRSTAIVSELDRLAALQLGLITRGLIERDLPTRDTVQLAQWAGAEREQVDALADLTPAGDLYQDMLSQPAVATANSIRQVILDGRGGKDALGSDPAAWLNAQTERVNGLWAIEQELSQRLEQETAAAGTAAREQTYFIGALSAALVGATLISAMVMAIRISRRLRLTRYAALTAARIELPTAISNVIAARDASMVRTALTESSSRIDALLHAGADEIGELASAFGAVHRQALRLAADQALLRMEVQAMFVALSRRGQTLVQRQIHLIDEFGRHEADPDALSRLFALDHLAARMRRNEENLLVLAGGEPGRWITRPVSLTDLIRAAAQETEEYRRVEIVSSLPVAVAAHVAGDAIHLLAELLENATSFSPPSAAVRVSAHGDAGGLSIVVSDSGIGMPKRQLAEANERLSRPLALTSTLVGTMGLLVVARLAQRHGIQVRLDAVAAAGTTATVTLPDRVVMPLEVVDRLEPEQRSRDSGHTMQLPAVEVPASPNAVYASAARPNEPLSPQPSAVPVFAHSGPTVSAHVPSPRAPRSEESVPLEVTAAGLPRRTAEEVPPSEAHRSLPTAALDPEMVRARLSSLATGLKAANRDSSPQERSSARPF